MTGIWEKILNTIIRGIVKKIRNNPHLITEYIRRNLELREPYSGWFNKLLDSGVIEDIVVWVIDEYVLKEA